MRITPGGGVPALYAVGVAAGRSLTAWSRIAAAILAFDVRGISTVLPAVMNQPAFEAESKPVLLPETSLATIASAPLRLIFARPLGTTSSVSAAKPITKV